MLIGVSLLKVANIAEPYFNLTLQWTCEMGSTLRQNQPLYLAKLHQDSFKDRRGGFSRDKRISEQPATSTLQDAV